MRIYQLRFLRPGSDPSPNTTCTRVYLRAFAPDDPAPLPAPGIVPLDDLPREALATFSAFAEQMADHGFAFLRDRIREQPMGPVLTVRRDDKIAGAIGPMETGTDSRGLT